MHFYAFHTFFHHSGHTSSFHYFSPLLFILFSFILQLPVLFILFVPLYFSFYFHLSTLWLFFHFFFLSFSSFFHSLFPSPFSFTPFLPSSSLSLVCFLPPPSVQPVSGSVLTGLSSLGTTPSLWAVRISRTLQAGRWRGKRQTAGSDPAPPAGAPPPRAQPASLEKPTHPTAGCTGVSLDTGRWATASTSPSLVRHTALETSSDA